MTRIVEDHARFKRALGDTLYEQRILRKWSQDATAFSVGISYAAYRAWENGRTFPSMPNLLTLCKVWNMRIGDLLGSAERRMAWAPRPHNKRRGKAHKVDTAPELCDNTHTIATQEDCNE